MEEERVHFLCCLGRMGGWMGPNIIITWQYLGVAQLFFFLLRLCGNVPLLPS
jgi:hypothetical protein